MYFDSIEIYNLYACARFQYSLSFVSFRIFLLLFFFSCFLFLLEILWIGDSHQNINSPMPLRNKHLHGKRNRATTYDTSKNWINIKMVSQLWDIRQNINMKCVLNTQRVKEEKKIMKTNRLSKCDGWTTKNKIIIIIIIKSNSKMCREKKIVCLLHRNTFRIVYFLTQAFFFSHSTPFEMKEKHIHYFQQTC